MFDDISGILGNLSIQNIFTILAIFFIAYILILLIQRLLPRIAESLPVQHRLRVLATVPVIRLSIILTAIALILPRIIEPTFENVIALLGALGLAIGFALKDYASSLIAGIVTLYEIPYRPGDWIEIDGTYGEVKSIGMRAVRILTPDDTVVIIPHQKFWDSLIFNSNDGTSNLMCVVSLYLDPNHDGMEVKKLLQDTALTSPFIQINKPVSVVAMEKPWATHYKIKAYPIDPRQQFQFISDITLRGKNALIASGFEFAKVSPVVE